MSALKELLAKGYRQSKLRNTIYDILNKIRQPISVEQLKMELKIRHLRPNKTSVYRELDTLLKENFVGQVDFLDGKKRYESLQNKDHHHHHFKCNKCQKVECLEIEEEINKLNTKLSAKYNFQIQKHHLEFFGLCEECKKKTEIETQLK